MVRLVCFALALLLPLRADDITPLPSLPNPPALVIGTDFGVLTGNFTFTLARPLPGDMDHVITLPLSGQRRIIHYLPAPGAIPLSVYQLQLYYEKQAATAGYTLEKTGAVGDVNETYRLKKGDGSEVWIYLEPDRESTEMVILRTSSASGVTEPSAPTPELTLAPKPSLEPVPPPPPPPSPTPEKSPATPPPSSSPPALSSGEDPIYAELTTQGRTQLYFDFLSARADLNTDAQPLLDRVVHILKKHPDLNLTLIGHTDNYGAADFNLDLSQQRARTVRLMLIQGGISRKRLTATGVGGSQPLPGNKEVTKQDEARDRRIELVVRKN